MELYVHLLIQNNEKRSFYVLLIILAKISGKRKLIYFNVCISQEKEETRNFSLLIINEESVAVNTR